MNISEAYKAAVKRHRHVGDEVPLRVVQALRQLQDETIDTTSLAVRLRSLLPGSITDKPRGMYL